MGANQKLRRRTVWLLIIVLAVGFGAVITRLAYLQLVQGEELQRRAIEQQLADTPISAKRGTIYDTKGKILAQSASVWQVVMAPAYFDDGAEGDEQRSLVASRLASILDLDEAELLEETKQNTYYVSVKRKVESEQKEQIIELQKELAEKYQKSGIISLLDDYKRYYPYSDLASSVIGFTGSEDQGLWGVEYQYNDYLSGTPGRIISAQNGIQTEMPFDYNQNIGAIDGSSVVLTIDETVQSIVEKYMKQGIIDNQVHERGVCIVMNVNNGEIVAMASVNGFDLNDPFTILPDQKKEIEAIDLDYLIKHDYFEEDEDPYKLSEEKKKELIEQAQNEAESAALARNWRNKAISDTYYPGSVFKMVTLSMALQEGVVNKDSRFGCSGAFQLYEDTIHCHNTAGHGTQTYQECLWNSCNPGFIQIGQLVGKTKFWEYYQAFGFSDKTGIDLPGESEDQFFVHDGVEGNMLDTDLAVASFGQNFSITPIQMITAASAVANGGKIVQPHVVKQILDNEGNVVKNASTETKRQVISESVSEEMRGIMEENCISGSGKNGYVAGYRVGGKTGTSEKLIDVNDDGADDYIASFCGFAPANNPQYAALVFFDAPLGGNYYGSAVAAPVFASIMSEVLPYLEVVAQYTDEEASNIDTAAGAYSGMSVDDAVAAAERDGFTVTVKGEGSTVVSQNPATGASMPTGGTIVLYTDQSGTDEKVTVPNLVGFSVSEVNGIASSYGLNVSVTGMVSSSDSTSTTQSVPEGTEVAPGTVITVTFSGSGIAD
ncbi:peptidoglycan D,D-transpeptidase FtsI family protein [Roseburia sp. MSJ-14]|uniref:peptidoglycan D,D-transpeptidase FtsI family protein n=1 Tax=Roseburia sp. MSJ-14 TaxID=2841514 RepID=UPI001C10DE18|nr:penicillin-binding transpeptidase domain-containing protein [Roseburia sp. MSJ-14]MBQ4238492.1 PASTA domain-containing protein [Ruminococcus sp.]MBU5474238.1 PASTA domain-containing protein [Roseburia sp. MSJ-14]